MLPFALTVSVPPEGPGVALAAGGVTATPRLRLPQPLADALPIFRRAHAGARRCLIDLDRDGAVRRALHIADAIKEGVSAGRRRCGQTDAAVRVDCQRAASERGAGSHRMAGDCTAEAA